MYKKTTVIRNKTGLHAKPASMFVSQAAKFKSRIMLRNVAEDEEVNARAIVLVLSLGLTKGSEVEISASGEDEQEAVDTLVELIESGFGETE